MEKSLHTLTLGGGGQTHSYVMFRYFIFEIARSSGLAGIIFHLRLEDKLIRMNCFFTCFTNNYSLRFNSIMLKNEIESYVMKEGRGLKNLTYP